MHVAVLVALGLALVFSVAAVIQMLVARPSIRSSTQWNAIFFPAGAFVVMSIVVLVDVGTKLTHSGVEYLLVLATLLLALGSAMGVRSLLQAMRVQQANEDELGFLRMRYERLFKGNEMPIVVFDHGSLAIVDVNGSGEALFGSDHERLMSAFFDALGFEQDARVALESAAAEGRRNVELRHTGPDGSPHDLLIHLSVGEVAQSKLVYGIIEDVTERNAARAELLEQKRLLAHLAEHDALTGLPNRRVLDAALERALARSRRDVPAALLFIDVDDFKRVNDLQGHLAGDAVLTSIAHLLSSGVRAGDIVVRDGGDEFAILLEGITLPGAAVIGERLVAATRARYAEVGLSIGAASLEGAADAADVIRRADQCMYAAKSAGGNRVVVADEQKG
jgi:diguanylate cyclase (GGDEF)-like protein